jgi:DNA polymerase I
VNPSDSKLLLIDGHSLAFRAYYAFAKGREGGLRTSTGIPTSVCFGFLKSLIEVISVEKPTYLAIAFDLGGPTYRHDADETYKAGRAETPEDFIPDIQNLQELLAALNLPIVIAPGYEADDVIGTLARKASHQGWQVKIVSGDRDLFQLVDDAGLVRILYLSNAFGAGRGSAATSQAFGPAEVLAKLEVRPDQVVDYKALCGDSSDNIPGVKGIGHKTAVQLLTQYQTLEGVYNALPEIKGAVQKKLTEGHHSALHSQYMAQIHLDVPLQVQPQDFLLQGFELDRITPVLEKLELLTFLRQLPTLQQNLGGSAEAKTQAQSASDTDDLWFFSSEDTPQGPSLKPQIIDTAEKLTQLVATLRLQTNPQTPVAWDTETTSLSPRDAQLVGIGCCWANYETIDGAPDGATDGDIPVAYIPIGHASGSNLPLTEVLEALRPILESDAYPKALQNAKFDRLVFQFQGIQLAGVVFDTMLASYVLNPDSSHNLTDLSRRYLNITSQSFTDLVPKGKTIADIVIPRVAEYCGLDVLTTYQLVEKLQTELVARPKLLSLFTEVEIPLEPVLAAMETHGIRIDQGYLHTFSAQLERDLLRLETEAYELAGETFNLGSPKQLSDILFEKLGLDAKKSRKTKLGFSTDAATLEKLQGDHPLVDILLEYRTLAKLKSTYVDALPQLVRADTQRVHTDFNQAVTATGRLSSSNPNLQNIPIRTAFSRQIRAGFIPEPGWVLVTADYSQIELRILAHLSEEPRLVEAYRQNQDVHTLTAQLLLEKDTITPDERRLAKIINFGVIYGMGAQRFSREAGVSYSEAKTFIDRFYERYPGVFGYLQRMEQEAIAQGYVETLLGRRRYFEFESSSLKQLHGKPLEELAALDLAKLKMTTYERGMLRAAANAPIQGSSADLIKVAMVQLQKAIAPHQASAPYQAHLLLQVHDELVLEVHPKDLETVKTIVQTTMEGAVTLSVPLVAEVHTGANWMTAK